MSGPSGLSRLPRWSVEVLRFVAMIAIALTVATVYTARGDNHDTVYWACLYAGSLSQVGTTEPANCGRGQKISWNAQGLQGLQGAPGISGLTTVKDTSSGWGIAGASSGHVLPCADGRVPIGSGYRLDTDPPGGVIVSSSYALAGNEDNPYGFEHYGDLEEDLYFWWFDLLHVVDDSEVDAELWVYCAWVDPPPDN